MASRAELEARRQRRRDKGVRESGPKETQHKLKSQRPLTAKEKEEIRAAKQEARRVAFEKRKLDKAAVSVKRSK